MIHNPYHYELSSDNGVSQAFNNFGHCLLLNLWDIVTEESGFLSKALT